MLRCGGHPASHQDQSWGKMAPGEGGLWVTASPSSGSSGCSGPKNFLPFSRGCRQLWVSPARSGSDDSRCWDGPKEQGGRSRGVAPLPCILPTTTCQDGQPLGPSSPLYHVQMGFLAVRVLTRRSFYPCGRPVVDLWPRSPAFRALLLLAGQQAWLGRTGFFPPQPWLRVPIFLSSAGGPESVSPHSGALFMKSN